MEKSESTQKKGKDMEMIAVEIDQNYNDLNIEQIKQDILVKMRKLTNLEKFSSNGSFETVFFKLHSLLVKKYTNDSLKSNTFYRDLILEDFDNTLEGYLKLPKTKLFYIALNLILEEVLKCIFDKQENKNQSWLNISAKLIEYSHLMKILTEYKTNYSIEEKAEYISTFIISGEIAKHNLIEIVAFLPEILVENNVENLYKESSERNEEDYVANFYQYEKDKKWVEKEETNRTPSIYLLDTYGYYCYGRELNLLKEEIKDLKNEKNEKENSNILEITKQISSLREEMKVQNQNITKEMKTKDDKISSLQDDISILKNDNIALKNEMNELKTNFYNEKTKLEQIGYLLQETLLILVFRKFAQALLYHCLAYNDYKKDYSILKLGFLAKYNDGNSLTKIFYSKPRTNGLVLYDYLFFFIKQGNYIAHETDNFNIKQYISKPTNPIPYIPETISTLLDEWIKLPFTDYLPDQYGNLNKKNYGYDDSIKRDLEDFALQLNNNNQNLKEFFKYLPKYDFYDPKEKEAKEA